MELKVKEKKISAQKAGGKAGPVLTGLPQRYCSVKRENYTSIKDQHTKRYLRIPNDTSAQKKTAPIWNGLLC